MKKFLMLVFAAVLAVSAVCFAEAPKAAEGTKTVQTQTAAAYKTLTPQQAKQRMEQNDKMLFWMCARRKNLQQGIFRVLFYCRLI